MKFERTKTSKKCPTCGGWLILTKARPGILPRHLPTINGRKRKTFYECSTCGGHHPYNNKPSHKAFCI